MAAILDFARKEVPAEPLAKEQVISLILVPWGIFLVECLLFLFLFHRARGFVLVVTFVGIVVSLIVIWIQQQRSTGGIPSILAFFCCIAFLASAFSGILTYHLCFEAYWVSADGHAYANILPSEPAAGYADASKLVFADEARVETSQAMGYKDGSVYCVAPILDDAPLENVQFWAAGENCCAARGSFSCDDAWNPNARSGMVIRSSDHVRSEYMNAIRQAEAAFEITSAEDPVFVTWVVDPEQLEIKMWAIGFGILVVAIVVHLVFSVIAAGFIRNEAKEATEKKP